ncbi:MAG: glucokinase [Candidatus Tectomicrobia bacterium]|uniref:Glucokinase n=1 Tax=Tectimicrobiota bacterium TaxID=2528274 RepID=A0A932M0D1_UNCTE|nr:glucokinase [Candidatus Tectomicrobia bacterium]
MILAGDIGGTNTRLAFVTVAGNRLELAAEAVYPSREYANMEAVLDRFISSHLFSVQQACFGAAGPVKHGRCEATNLPWVVDSRQLAEQLRIEKVGLINDLEANAYGIAALEERDFAVLNEGAADAGGNQAVISAGTGLGEAGLYWDGRRHRVFASEGGHADFAPRNPLEMELLRYLLTKFKRVSCERVLSGPGLLNIYQFFRDSGGAEEPAWLSDKMRRHDPAAVITQEALEATSPLCVQALELFVSLYGAEAGNLALKVMATGGLFVGGGIGPKIIQKLTDSTFLESFTAKGRMKPLLEAIPVRVILNDKTALLGAARCAVLSVTRDP